MRRSISGRTRRASTSSLQASLPDAWGARDRKELSRTDRASLRSWASVWTQTVLALRISVAEPKVPAHPGQHGSVLLSVRRFLRPNDVVRGRDHDREVIELHLGRVAHPIVVHSDAISAEDDLQPSILGFEACA